MEIEGAGGIIEEGRAITVSRPRPIVPTNLEIAIVVRNIVTVYADGLLDKDGDSCMHLTMMLGR